MSTNAVFDGGAADQQAEYAAAADHEVDSTSYQLPDGRTVIGRAAYEASAAAAAKVALTISDYDHETFLADKDAISGLDLEPAAVADVVHITPTADRTALCLEVNGTFAQFGALLAQPLPACRECLAIALRLKDIEMHDLARLVAGVAATVPVLPLAWQLDTEAVPVRDLSTREIVAVRLLLDPAVSLSVIKADLWQELRADRPQLYAALCAGDVSAAYAAAP